MQHQLIKLKTNLNTLFINNPGSSAASVQIWFRAGSALEKSEEKGIAHFLEHMFFKGTPSRPGSTIAHEIESFGGELNAFTSFDYTCYYINTPIVNLNQSIDILLDMVSNPSFLNDELIPERGVVFEEYLRSLDNPGQYSFQRLQKTCFPVGYRHPILGEANTIKRFSKKQLISFKKRYYNSSNALLVVAGNIDSKNKLIKTINKYPIGRGKKSTFPVFELRNSSTIDIHQKDVRMAQINIALKAPAFLDPNAAEEDLAINCLGHGETSRLFHKLVLETNDANSCSSSTIFMSQGGVHNIRITCPFSNLQKVLNSLFDIIKKIIVNGFTKREVEKIKNQYIASKVYDKESLESYSFSLGHSFAQTGDIYSEEQFINRIKECSVHSINKAIKAIINRPIHLSLQIPKTNSISVGKRHLVSFQKKMQGLLRKEINRGKNRKAIKFSLFDKQVKIIPIKEGVTLIYRQNTITPTFIFHAHQKGGLTEEIKRTNGIYNLMSGIITKGYGQLDYEMIKTDLENKSASLSGFSGKNAYGLTMHGQSKDAYELMKHFFGSFLRPNVSEKYINYEKEMTLRQIESQKEDPIRNCFNRVNEIFFNKHPYSMDILGSEKSIINVTRKKILNLHNKNLKNKDLLFTFCGDLELNTVLDLIYPEIDSLSPKKKKRDEGKIINPYNGKTSCINMIREQTHIFIGIPTKPIGHNENIYLKMLTAHLSGQSSALFTIVRDKLGLCYAIQPIHFTALEGGYWGIYTACSNDKVGQTISAIKNILDNLTSKGIRSSEFNRIKKMIRGQNLLNLQTNEDYANIYSIPVLHGYGLDFYYKTNDVINRMGHQTFQENMKKIMNKKWNMVIVGKEESFSI